jgi:hypothetical protein
VSFHQRIALFEAFGSGVAGFHERFFLVRPRTKAALQSILKIVERPRGVDGVVSVRVPRFHFSWSRDHLKHEPAMYRYNYDRLTDQNKDSFAKLVGFVNSFSRSEVVDDDGSPMLDSRGNPVTICNSSIFARFILLFIYVCYMCSYVINCLCVYFWLGIVEFSVRGVF